MRRDPSVWRKPSHTDVRSCGPIRARTASNPVHETSFEPGRTVSGQLSVAVVEVADRALDQTAENDAMQPVRHYALGIAEEAKHTADQAIADEVDRKRVV